MVPRPLALLRRAALRRLEAMIPPGCPIVAGLSDRGLYARTGDGRDTVAGRSAIVAAWIAGYVAAWSAARRITPDLSGEVGNPPRG